MVIYLKHSEGLPTIWLCAESIPDRTKLWQSEPQNAPLSRGHYATSSFMQPPWQLRTALHCPNPRFHKLIYWEIWTELTNVKLVAIDRATGEQVGHTFNRMKSEERVRSFDPTRAHSAENVDPLEPSNRDRVAVLKKAVVYWHPGLARGVESTITVMDLELNHIRDIIVPYEEDVTVSAHFVPEKNSIVVLVSPWGGTPNKSAKCMNVLSGEVLWAEHGLSFVSCAEGLIIFKPRYTSSPPAPLQVFLC